MTLNKAIPGMKLGNAANATVRKYGTLVHAINSLTDRGVARKEVFDRLGDLLEELGLRNLAADCRSLAAVE